MNISFIATNKIHYTVEMNIGHFNSLLTTNLSLKVFSIQLLTRLFDLSSFRGVVEVTFTR